jgi:hypothetical protein
MPEPIKQRVAEVVSPGIPRGMDLLDTPLLNKGTAFSDTERTQFGLHGLLPPHVETLEEQVVRAYEAYARKNDDLERHIYLRALQDAESTHTLITFMRNPRTALPVGHEIPTETLASPMSLDISMQRSLLVSLRLAALFQKQLFGRWRGKSSGQSSFHSRIRRQNLKQRRMI